MRFVVFRERDLALEPSEGLGKRREGYDACWLEKGDTDYRDSRAYAK
jgi:hypothetical protein